MMNISTTTAIQQSFQTAVNKYIQKQRKKRSRNIHNSDQNFHYENELEQRALYLTKHSIHILHQLTLKRQSLSNAILAFELICTQLIESCSSNLQQPTATQSSRPVPKRSLETNNSRTQVTTSLSPKSIQAILTHFFTYYLYIRDGFILLTSGECRHIGDEKIAKSKRLNPFQSRLNCNYDDEGPSGKTNHSHGDDKKSELKRKEKNSSSVIVRNDGYTKLYSSKYGYSGFGWDEFFNEDVGIRRRLLDILYKLSIDMKSTKDMNIFDSSTYHQYREKIWDKLLDYGAQSLEQAFDTHDEQMKELQRNLEHIRMNYMKRFESLLSSYDFSDTTNRFTNGAKLIMVTEDKLERLEIQNGHRIGLAAFSIQRQGDSFRLGNDEVNRQQVNKKPELAYGGGVLPIHATIEDWLSKMKLPSTILREEPVLREKDKNAVSDTAGNTSRPNKKKKMRRIIDDDEEEDDDDENGDKCQSLTVKNADTNQVTVTGLKVTIQESNKPNSSNGNRDSKDENIESSIRDIKKQLGIDVVELEKSREELEAEESRTNAFAHAEEIGMILNIDDRSTPARLLCSDDDMIEIQGLIIEEFENVEILRSICKRKNKGDDEAWDARESLRESTMTLGIFLLELYEMSKGTGDKEVLKQAESCFKEALEVIQDLESWNVIDKSNANDSLDNISFRTRALLLCRGRAHTNLGKTYLKQYEVSSRTRPVNTLLGNAIKHLKAAVRVSTTLRAHSVTSSVKDHQARLHKVEADELESLSCRYLGNALWTMSNYKEAITFLKKGGGFGEDFTSTLNIGNAIKEGLFDTRVRLLVEQYYNAMCLANLCRLGIRQYSSFPSSKSEYDTDFDQQMFDSACEGYKRSEDISAYLMQLSSHKDGFDNDRVQNIMIDNEILSKYEINRLHVDIMKLWENHKRIRCLSKDQLINNVSNILPTYNRADVNEKSKESLLGRIPTLRFTVDENQKPQNNRKKASTNLSSEAKIQQQQQIENDDFFDNFGLHTNLNDDENKEHFYNKQQGHHYNQNIKYRKWGDDLLINPKAYPACEPEKPPEMIQELSVRK